MLDASRHRIEQMLPDDALVLDVGGWAKPLERADWVLDVFPYETRGLYGYDLEASRPRERFDASRWVVRDMCDHEPWPFADGQFDFAICSHTLEDIRDPLWVCHELMRVSKAGYLEVPDRREEQTYGVHGPFVGWSHHRWLVDMTDDGITFVIKTRDLEARADLQYPRALYERLSPEDKVQQLWWEGPFRVEETVVVTEHDMAEYLKQVVPSGGATAERQPAPSRARRIRRKLARR